MLSRVQCWHPPGWTRLRTVVVAGQSMAPTVQPGDFLLVRRPAVPYLGAIVLARHPARWDLLVVKRITARTESGWWLTGDNPLASDDSRAFGPVLDEAVLARVLGCYWPIGRLGAV